jgi:hypothetical protein
MRALFALFGLSACQLATQSADTAAPDPAEAAAWRGALLGGVQAADRAFTPAGPGCFEARHLGWGYALQVDEAGLHVGHGAAELSLRFSGWGRAEHTEAVPPVAPEIGGCAEDGERLPDGGCAPELAYVYPGGVTAWIDNTAAGPRQRWTLEERPDGEGLLALEVEVSGAELSTDGALVLLRDLVHSAGPQVLSAAQIPPLPSPEVHTGSVHTAPTSESTSHAILRLMCCLHASFVPPPLPPDGVLQHAVQQQPSLVQDGLESQSQQATWRDKSGTKVSTSTSESLIKAAH